MTAEVLHDERLAYEAMLKAITIKTKGLIKCFKIVDMNRRLM